MEATFEGGQGPEGTVVPWMNGWITEKVFFVCGHYCRTMKERF
jgi:hypothetical protein